MDEDEYEVEADFIEIRDEHEEEYDTDATDTKGEDKTNKTVGKDSEE